MLRKEPIPDFRSGDEKLPDINEGIVLFLTEHPEEIASFFEYYLTTMSASLEKIFADREDSSLPATDDAVEIKARRLARSAIIARLIKRFQKDISKKELSKHLKLGKVYAEQINQHIPAEILRIGKQILLDDLFGSIADQFHPDHIIRTPERMLYDQHLHNHEEKSERLSEVVKILSDLGLSYDFIIGQPLSNGDNGYVGLIIPSINKVIFVRDQKKHSTYIIHRNLNENDWHNFSFRTRTELRALQPSGLVSVVEGSPEQAGDHWQKAIEKALQKPSLETNDDISDVLASQEITPPPGKQMSLKQLHASFTVNYDKLLDRINTIMSALAEEKGIADPNKLMEWYLNGSGIVAAHYPEEVYYGLKEAMPEVQLEKSDPKEWKTIHYICKKVGHIDASTAEEIILEIADELLLEIKEIDTAYSRKQWIKDVRTSSSHGHSICYQAQLADYIIKTLKDENAINERLRSERRTVSQMRTILRKKYDIKVGKASIKKVLDKFLDTQNEYNVSYLPLYRGNKHPYYSLPLAEKAIAQIKEQWEAVPMMPSNWQELTPLIARIATTQGIDKANPAHKKNFRRIDGHVRDIIRRHPDLAGPRRIKGKIAFACSPAMEQILREKFDYKY